MAEAADDQNESGGPIRVMVVDDSAVIRGLFSRWLDEREDVQVTATCANGAHAVRRLKPSRAEVVVLDIEMPEMDGLEALPLLLEQDPNLRVLIASTLTKRNAEISLKALSLGATDYVTKPSAQRAVTTSAEFRRELVEKVIEIARAARVERGESMPQIRHKPVAPGDPVVAPEPRPQEKAGAPDAFTLRKPGHTRPKVLVVGASTGGPKALASFVASLDGKLDVPMLVTQHMPAMFTAILAEHLDRVSAMSAAEAVHKEAIKPGHIYVAPGGRHLVVRGTADEPFVELNDDPPENFCRPAVDPLFRTAANVFGAGTLGVVLTGMGSDGRQGARVIVDGGGTVLAQDRDSSVVWGMPGAVAMDGLCASVEPVNDLAQQVLKLSKGVRA